MYLRETMVKYIVNLTNTSNHDHVIIIFLARNSESLIRRD